MSKAVEKAYEAYPLNAANRLNHEWNAKRVGFQQGYHQAEKDLELTWEDISIIREILCGTVGYPLMTDKEVCIEVLERFKYFKERKEK